MVSQTNPLWLLRLPDDASGCYALSALTANASKRLGVPGVASSQTMCFFLNIVARRLGVNSPSDCYWAALRHRHALTLIEMLRDSDRAVDTYLSALKGRTVKPRCSN